MNERLAKLIQETEATESWTSLLLAVHNASIVMWTVEGLTHSQWQHEHAKRCALAVLRYLKGELSE